MFRLLAPAASFLGIVLTLSTATVSLCAAKSDGVIQQDRVIAGGPESSLEVRHLVLRGSNEEIGRALAEIAKERYGVPLEPAPDPLQVRAQRKFLERNYPILFERMRGVAAAYGKSIDDDAYDFSWLTFMDLEAGCSIAHLPPSSSANGKSVVSRDYDFTTGGIDYQFLKPGMLHPTARPYLLELHPDQGYASIAMVSYDLLSGVLDGINSEGLTVTLAGLFKDASEPTRVASVGLGELQTVRMLLDTCASVEEAKQALRATKQYYQYVPVHYLIADRSGKAFVWEYSEAHNQEYVIENPGQPLFMTNFTLHDQLENGMPPSAEKARSVCKRYAYLKDKLATGTFDDQAIRRFHQTVDAQMSQAADTTAPPERTLWHAFYYPEDRRVRVSYYLRDEPHPTEPRFVRPVRSEYQEFRLEPTATGAVSAGRAASAALASSAAPAASAPATSAATVDDGAAIEAAGGALKREDGRIVAVGLTKVAAPATVIPVVARLRDLETVNLGNAATTDADVRALQALPKLKSLGLMGAPIGDATIAALAKFPALRILNLSDTKVTDAGLEHLSGLTALEYLALKGTAVSDRGLAHLENLTNLTNLILADTKVTDAGLPNLFGMKRLEAVNLSNADITDAGLAHLAGMRGLAGINLTGTKVTDAGLAHLKALPKLTKLNVSGTAVTEQGVQEAKKYLPMWATVTR
jgi:penicillin V acylase-like amidase (Ntn superfamily)